MYGSNLRQVLPRDLQASFDTSSQLFHTVTFPRTYEAQTPPNVTYTLVCDLVNIELPSNVETSPQNVTVRFLQSKWNNYTVPELDRWDYFQLSYNMEAPYVLLWGKY